MNSLTVKVEEMIARELRAARGWLIAVALVAFVQQILFAYNLPPKIESKHQLFVIIACVQFAVFFGSWLLSYWKPRFSLILALIDFWIIQVFVIVTSPLESVFSLSAIVFRLAFTLALIGGITAAYRAEEMERNRQASDTPVNPDEDASESSVGM
jgi:cbb3-type cytochrome oxidase subunit 3